MTSKIFAERLSIRSYVDRPVEDDKLEAVLEAARQAPSWANMQCWTYIVVRDPEIREAVAATLANNPIQKAVRTAPVLIVACADPEKSGNANAQPYYMLDIGISFQQLVLEAWNQGLGTCWVGWIKEDEIRSILGVPDDIRVVALTPLGYPAVLPESPGRKPLDEVVRYEKWSS
jgi:nitroreductase